MIATPTATLSPIALDRIQKIKIVRQQNKENRYARIRERFNYLYNSERKRYDDCIDTVSNEFGLAKSSIQPILKG
jgi:hypothetical protein